MNVLLKGGEINIQLWFLCLMLAQENLKWFSMRCGEKKVRGWAEGAAVARFCENKSQKRRKGALQVSSSRISTSALAILGGWGLVRVREKNNTGQIKMEEK